MRTPAHKVTFWYRTVGSEAKQKPVFDQFTPIARTCGRAGDGRHAPSVEGDAESLPVADSSFNAATVGFGLRNLVRMDGGLRASISPSIHGLCSRSPFRAEARGGL